MIKILKSDISKNILYEDWCNSSYKVFSKFKDEDFFSDKVQHIYFYSDINDDSVNELQRLLMECSKTVLDQSGVQSSPKPICVHLNSPGGWVSSTDIFYTIIQTQRVPLCFIIEKLCASAATFIQLLSPYRIMIDYSEYMIHDMIGGNYSKGENTVKSKYTSFHSMIYYKELLKQRTKLTDSEIKNFFERDIYVDAKYCLKKGIIDRILKFPKINKPEYYSSVSNLQLNLGSFLKKTNLNHIYIDDRLYDNSDKITSEVFSSSIQNTHSLNDLCIALDSIFLMKKNSNVKPIIIHFKPFSYGLFSNANPLELVSLNYRLAQIQKTIPIIAFIEGVQFFDTLSTIMMCPIRIMMKPSIIKSTFSFNDTAFGWKAIDVINNSLFEYNQIVKFYKEFTKLPKTYYSEIRKKIINLDENDLLKYNIIHLCLNIVKKKIDVKDIMDYLQINSLTGIKNMKNRNVK
jgi:ATP-dependent protease ClpP protease subunit